MKIFLSYASADREGAHEIAEALRDEGHDVYPAAHWPEDVHAALKRADAFVVLLSPAAVDSLYVNEEIKQALVAERLADRLIPVVLEPSRRVPWILQEMEPISAKPSARATAEAISKRLRPHGGGHRAAQ